MPYKYKILLWVAPFVLAADQVTKFLILKFIPFGGSVPVVNGFFDLVHIRNTGAAFGMLATLSPSLRVPFFYGISIVAVAVLIYAFRHLENADRFYPWPLSLITAGVFGNLIDRVRFGNVVDFISLHIQDKIIWGIKMEWPAFNVADSAITVSMVLLAAHLLKQK